MGASLESLLLGKGNAAVESTGDIIGELAMRSIYYDVI